MLIVSAVGIAVTNHVVAEDSTPAGQLVTGPANSASAAQGDLRAREVAERQSDPLTKPISFSPQRVKDRGAEPSAPASYNERAIMTLVGGLAICVGAFLLFMWATRRTTPHGLAPLPSEVVEPLGRTPLSNRQYLQLIRLGQKLVLICVSPQGVTPLAEVNDADEATRLAGLCQQAKPQSVTASFRDVLSDYDQQPTGALVPGSSQLADREPARRSSPRRLS